MGVEHELVAHRWTRFGHDRLYVTGSDGRTVGYADLVRGTRVLDDPRVADEFHQLLDAHPLIGTVPPTPTSGHHGSQGPTVAPEPPCWDLAANPPGATARDRATQEWVAAKQRSPFAAYARRIVGTQCDERSWRIGAKGEAVVGVKLNRLTRNGWRVLHAVPVGVRGSDIDHLLIGPGGVWTVNTKTHPGGRIWISRTTVKVNGHSVPYLRNSRHEAARAARLLGAGLFDPPPTVRSRPADVAVLTQFELLRWFRRLQPEHPASWVEEVYEIARRSTTWLTTPSSPAP